MYVHPSKRAGSSLAESMAVVCACVCSAKRLRCFGVVCVASMARSLLRCSRLAPTSPSRISYDRPPIQSHQSNHIHPTISIQSHQSNHINPITSSESHQSNPSNHINPITSIQSHQSNHINPIISIQSHQANHINRITTIQPHQHQSHQLIVGGI